MLRRGLCCACVCGLSSHRLVHGCWYWLKTSRFFAVARVCLCVCVFCVAVCVCAFALSALVPEGASTKRWAAREPTKASALAW